MASVLDQTCERIIATGEQLAKFIADNGLVSGVSQQLFSLEEGLGYIRTQIARDRTGSLEDFLILTRIRNDQLTEHLRAKKIAFLIPALGIADVLPELIALKYKMFESLCQNIIDHSDVSDFKAWYARFQAEIEFIA